MNETELEKLVVRLTGDASQYLAMLKEAQQAAAKTASDVKENAEKVEGFLNNLQGFASGVTSVLGSLKIIDFLKEAKGEWQAAETAAFRLNSVLKANKRDVEGLAEEYGTFATQLQKTTTYSDEQVLGLVRMAETFGLTGEAAKGATKDAMALAAATDVSAEGAMRLTRAMTEGNTEQAMMFSRMIPQLRGIKDEQEFTIKYQQLISAGQQTLNDELQTGAGRAKNFENQYSDMLEEIGKHYSEVVNPLKTFKKEAVAAFGSLDDNTKKTVISLAGWTANMGLALGAATAFSAALPTIQAGLAAVNKQLMALAKNPLTWVVLAAVEIRSYARETVEASESTKKLHEAIKGLEKTRQKQAGESEEKTKSFIKANIGDPKAMREEGEKQKKALEELYNELAKKKEDLDAALLTRSHHTPFTRGEQFRRFINKQFGAEYGRFEKEMIKDTEAEIASVVKAQEMLNNAMKEAKSSPIAKVDEANKMVQALHEEAEALKGTARDLEIYKAKKEGFNDISAGLIADATALHKNAESYKEVTESLEDFIKAKKNERAELGLSDDEKKLAELKRKLPYATPELLERFQVAEAEAKATRLATEEYERQKKAADELAESLKKVVDLKRDAAAAGSAEAAMRLWDRFGGGGGNGRNVNEINDAPAVAAGRPVFARGGGPQGPGFDPNALRLAQEDTVKAIRDVVKTLNGMARVNLGFAGLN